MTRDQVKKMLPAMIAYAEGKDIQVRGGFVTTWEDIVNPGFIPSHEYREKPPMSEAWAFTNCDGCTYFFAIKENAEIASVDAKLGRKYTVFHFHLTD